MPEKTWAELVLDALEATGVNMPGEAFIDPLSLRSDWEILDGICPRSKQLAEPECASAVQWPYKKGTKVGKCQLCKTKPD
jgi:hypothetical protein